MVQNNLELMRTLDDSWNVQDWDTFEKRHSKDTTVFWPGQAEPKRARQSQGGVRRIFQDGRGHLTSPASALGLIPLSCDYSLPPKERTAPVAIQRWLAPGRSGPIRIRKSGLLQVAGGASNVPENSALPRASSGTGGVVKMV